MNTAALRDLTQRSLAEIYRCFGDIYCHYLQYKILSQAEKMDAIYMGREFISRLYITPNIN
jgi:hypothetical protein